MIPLTFYFYFLGSPFNLLKKLALSFLDLLFVADQVLIEEN